ncbi:MAG: aldehyde dehydrogenase family protein, partial [Acidobacteriia bacterium 12-62-4]
MPETFRNYINGEWVDGPTFENRNPANTDEVVGLFVKGTAADVDRAADAAQAAFAKWSSMPGPARGALLFKVADILEKKFDQLGEEMCREEGKTVPEAKGEVRRAINIFRYFGSEGSRLPGHLVPSERDRVHMFAIRKPIGVVGLITPWNFPIAIRALVNAKPVKAISFTGSVEIGNWVHTEGSKRHLRLQLEMGGKNPTIVLADCDFNSAVENVVNAAFFSTGQKCTATSRAIVEAPIYDKFVAALVERTKKLKVGNGMEAGIDIGPAVDEGQLETDLKYIDIGRKENGEPLCGGNRLTGGAYDKGYFVEPTVFADVKEGDTLAKEEVFGPVLAIMKANDPADALRMANATEFGLSASIQTTNISRVF